MTEPIPTPRIGKTARNEMRKAIATTANALSIAMLLTTGLQPAFSGKPIGASGIIGMAAFVALQGVGHYVLRRVED
jgi:hypothetical protein